MRFTRVGGIAGIAFVGLVIGANAPIAASGKPTGEASVAEVAAWFTENDGIALLVSTIAPLVWIALPIFAVGVLYATRDAGGRFNPWAILGVVGAVMQNAVFTMVVATDTVLAVRADTLLASPEFTLALWDLQHAVFLLNGASLTLALGGFALATLTSETATRWFGVLGLVGAGLLGLSATRAASAVGGPEVVVGFPGFIVWMVWILGFGIKLARSREDITAPAVPATA